MRIFDWLVTTYTLTIFNLRIGITLSFIVLKGQLELTAPAFNCVGVKAKPNTAEQATTNLNLNAKSAAEEDTFELSAPQVRSGAKLPKWLLPTGLLGAVATGLVSCGESKAPEIAQAVNSEAPKIERTIFSCGDTIRQQVIGITPVITDQMAQEIVPLNLLKPGENLYRTSGGIQTEVNENNEKLTNKCLETAKAINDTIDQAIQNGDDVKGVKIYTSRTKNGTSPLDRLIVTKDGATFTVLKTPKPANSMEKPVEAKVPAEGFNTDSTGSYVYVSAEVKKPELTQSPTPSASPTSSPKVQW